MDDLSHSVKLFKMDINNNFLHLENRDFPLADVLSFLRYCAPSNISEKLLLFIVENNTAIVSRQNKFYRFDSHSRHSRGLCVRDGTSVLFRLMIFKGWKCIFTVHTENL